MAKASAIQKNLRKKSKSSVGSAYSKREKLRAIIKSKKSSIEERFEASLALSSLPRYSSRCAVRNRCFITGRPRGYYRKFGISRIALRDMALSGAILGVKKSSW